MRELFPYLKLIHGSLTRSLLLGLALACIAGGAAISLVSLSGWFITMSALVGLLGITSFSYLFPSGGIRAFALLRTLARYSERVVNHQATFFWLARLRVSFFKRALRLPVQRITALRSGDLLSRVMADIDTLDQVLLRVLIPTMATCVVVVGSVAFIEGQSILLALLATPPLLIAALGLPIAMAWSGRQPGSHLVAVRARLRTRCIEALQGRREIASYRAEAIVKQQFLQDLGHFEHAQRRMQRLSVTGSAISTSLASATVLLVLSVGLLFMTKGTQDGPVLVMICLLLTGLFESIESLPQAYQFMSVVRTAARRLDTIFCVENPGREKLGEASHPFPENQILCLQAVSFRYDGQHRVALQGLSFSVSAGTVVAIMGRSGIGKSTLLKLIAREIEPERGRITMGEVPLAAIAWDEFQRHVTLVSQDSHIFNATLRENLLMARQDATSQEIQDVLAVVCLTDLLERLERGLDTNVGEQGYMLSGGERRRLCIARALLRAPSLLLLDEPTVGVDHATAERMMASIRAFLPKSTIIIATHDPALMAMTEQRISLNIASQRQVFQ